MTTGLVIDTINDNCNDYEEEEERTPVNSKIVRATDFKVTVETPSKWFRRMEVDTENTPDHETRPFMQDFK